MIATSATITNPFRRFLYNAGVSGASRVRETNGGEILPDRVALEWSTDEEGWHLQWAEVSGPKLKANGKPGSRRSFALFIEDGGDWPAWLTQLVADQTPKEA